MSLYYRFKLGLAGLMCAVTLLCGLAQAKNSAETDRQITISLAELPNPGAQIYARIHQGGPFKSEKDGVVFANRERLLPAHKRGYYREYTVPTPGLKHRGARRIVCGGAPQRPDVCYFSADHYASFIRIAP